MTPSIHILIVDDDAEICELLSSYLTGYGMTCHTAGEGKAMKEAIAQQDFDLIILDLMLPGEDGLTLCRYLRSQYSTPIIMLTARGEYSDRVVGLELGADDYVVKPFDPRELVARIHSVLRRTQHVLDTEKDNPNINTQEIIRFNDWELNCYKREVCTPQKLVVPLSNAEYRLLTTFLERPQRVLNREQLLDAARGRTAEIYDRSIDLLVSRLRQKLGDDPRSPSLLKTIRGEGYLLDARVSR